MEVVAGVNKVQARRNDQLTCDEEKIVRCICEATKTHFKKKGAAEWTKIIMRALRKWGKDRGYVDYPSRKKNGRRSRREWLYDFCWRIQGKGKSGWKKHFKGLPLIAEIEWKKREGSILEEFYKLTVGIAKYRLLVISYYDKGDGKLDMKCLESVIQKCAKTKSGKEFRYLTIAIPEKEKENIKAYLVENNKHKEINCN